VDVAYGIVPREDVVRAFPRVHKTFVRLKEGTFTGGSLVLLRPRAFHSARPWIERAIRARKRPWELARVFGLRVVVGLLTGRLRIGELERRAQMLTGIRARAVLSHDPEIAIDVDQAEVLAEVQEYLERLAQSPAHSVARKR
jgi:hypothetical protein